MKRGAYYNEFDRGAAAWLRELIGAGLIAPGDVDERSIADVSADDLVGYSQCHWFAGIGGWSLALRLAGWPDERAVWTGSCPCQPFSVAGKGLGERDERHVWPEFRRLIGQCRPAIVFGEQVASAAGRAWLAGVFADLEALGYKGAGADLCAAGVGAPHIRQRLYWVADAGHAERRPWNFSCDLERPDSIRQEWEEGAVESGECLQDGGVADAESQRGGSGEAGARGRAEFADGDAVVRVENASCVGRRGGRDGDQAGNGGTLQIEGSSAAGRLEQSSGDGREPRGAESGGRGVERGCGAAGGVGDVQRTGLEGLAGDGDGGDEPGRIGAGAGGSVGAAGAWADSRWIVCRDGKARRVPVESFLFPLADGVPGRVGLLRGAGNAIVPGLAAEFIRAAEEARMMVV